MSSMFESDQAAAEALASANTADVVAGGVTEQADPAPATQDETVEPGTTSTEDTFTSIDLESLPPEVREAYKNMQGDYTRKTQEIAPLRQALQDSGMDAGTARQALEFVQALNDPTNLQALYQRLHSEYGEETSGEFPDYEGTFGNDEEADPRDQLLAQVQSRLDQMERKNVETEVKAELDRMEAVVRTGHPEWDDEDLNTVARLAIPYQGDLMRAAKDYGDLRQRIVSAHISGKAQVPAGATGIGATGHAETPQKFDSLDDAHDAALQLLAADLSN